MPLKGIVGLWPSGSLWLPGHEEGHVALPCAPAMMGLSIKETLMHAYHYVPRMTVNLIAIKDVEHTSYE